MCCIEVLLGAALIRSPRLFGGINTCRIYQQFPMQTEKSQPEGKQIMPETNFTEFTALSVDPRAGISGG